MAGTEHTSGADQAIGYYASVSLPALAAVPDAWPALAQYLLAPAELSYVDQCPSRRRTIEYLGGRLAAKLAVLRAVAAHGHVVAVAPRHLAVLVLCDGQRVVDVGGVGRFNVSISHCPSRAVAAAMRDVGALGIDVEDRNSRVRLDQAYFLPIELRTACNALARQRWMVKEALTKVLGGHPRRYVVAGNTRRGMPLAVIGGDMNGGGPSIALGSTASVAFRPRAPMR